MSILKERRKYIRIPLHIPFTMKDNTSSSEVITHTRDISATGMMCELAKKIDNEIPVSINLNLPTVDEPVSITAKVVRVATGKSNLFETGIKFLNIEKNKKLFLMKFLCDNLCAKSN